MEDMSVYVCVSVRIVREDVCVCVTQSVCLLARVYGCSSVSWSVGFVYRVGTAASTRETSSLTREVAATTPSEKEEAVVVGASSKPAAVSGVALAVAGALATAPAAFAIAEMPSPAGTMGGALPALATILFVFLPVAFLIVLYVKTDDPTTD